MTQILSPDWIISQPPCAGHTHIRTYAQNINAVFSSRTPLIKWPIGEADENKNGWNLTLLTQINVIVVCDALGHCVIVFLF